MKKAAIIIASGFEEGEALTIADIIKRAHLQCDLVGFEQEVKGGHEIIVRCDHILNETLLDYDMVILPGGYGGAEAMKNNPTLISYLQQMNEKGKYVCAACGNLLFKSDAKFHSDCGWPSFDKAVKGSVTYVNDNSFGMTRTEVNCANCGSHLGHVFDDGPKETTGQRFCTNSVSVSFIPEK